MLQWELRDDNDGGDDDDDDGDDEYPKSQESLII
jgi:hypothetical protein